MSSSYNASVKATSDLASKQAKPKSLSSIAASWGYARTRASTSTIGLLQKIESADSVTSNLSLSLDRTQYSVGPAELGNTYADFVKRLPRSDYLRKLLDIFLDDINWQYGAIDTESFENQLCQWQKIPITVLTSVGPGSLAQYLQVFPAILFQMIATSVLFLSDQPEDHSIMDSIKSKHNQTCLDLAEEYSEIGQRICVLLGKDALSLDHIIAKFLRAAFQKFTSRVKESWHTVAEAIRDAQELGMHSDSLDPPPSDNSPEAVLKGHLMGQRRRYMYMLLVTW